MHRDRVAILARILAGVCADDDYNLFKGKLMARIPKISTPSGIIPLAHDG